MGNANVLKQVQIPLQKEVISYYGLNILDDFSSVLNQYQFDKIFFISEPTIYAIHGHSFFQMLQKKQIPSELLLIGGSEDDKTFSCLGDLCDELIRRNISKDSIMISFGGGIVGNIVGLAAALIYRGVRYIEIPTTFMGQTDSTLSNKQAVNGGSGKNQLGLYHAPLFVWSDLNYILSESQRHIKAGIVEGIKNTLIQDNELYPYFENNNLANADLDGERLLTLFEIITGSKNKILQKDPTEKKYAIILEYGHTFGHSIEFLTHGRIIHGEAVAAGMCIAAELSYSLGHMSQELLEKHYQILGDFINKDMLSDDIRPLITPEKIMEEIQNDNKRTKSGIKYVLIDEIGHCMNPDGDWQVEVDSDTVLAGIRTFFEKIS